ncbi:putative DD41D transposase [Trichonephila clavipes]|nr:putative DD41D transposase [Trichonephila clavipes]
MSRFGGLSEEKPSVFKTPSKLGTHLSTQCSGDEGRVDLAQPVNRTQDLKTDCLVTLWAGGIIGSYFFKNDEDHNVTVNGDRYRAMITNFFIPELNNHDVQELWFQQDGATGHTARATIDLLKDTFGDRLFSRFGPVNWPPRFCDLTPLDYFLWGYVKSLVYTDKPQTLDNLEDNICRVIADLRPQMEKVIENWTSRLDYIRASRGSHMQEIIFKMETKSVTPKPCPLLVTGSESTVEHVRESFQRSHIVKHRGNVANEFVFTRTIRRRKQQIGLPAKRPFLRLPLTQNHRCLCRQWCYERRMWAAE